MKKNPINTIEELTTALENGKTVFDWSDCSYRKAKPPYKGYIMEDSQGIQYAVPFVEFEIDVYHIVEE